MKFEDLQKQVLDWAEEKDLLHEKNAEKQFMKFIEEVFEFKTELDYVNIVNEDEDYTEEFKNFCRNSLQLEFGDVFVTLIILAKQLDLNLTQCLEKAYKKIQYRKGKTKNGIFVKEEDLPMKKLKNNVEFLDSRANSEKQEIPYEVTDMRGMFAINNTDIPF